MKSILVVDDDKCVRAAMKSALEPHRDEFTVLEAAHGGEALPMLEERKVDLLITDLWMPVMDGFQLLMHLMNHHPELPVVVLSSHEPWDGVRGPGTVLQVPCLAKPVSAQRLLFEVRELLNTQARGRRVGVTLLGLLQLLAREHRTCMLEVSAGERTGAIHVFAGEIVHAKAAQLEGEDALFEVLSWREPRVHGVPALTGLKLTVGTRMDWLLAKARDLQEAADEPGIMCGERGEASGCATGRARGGAPVPV